MEQIIELDRPIRDTPRRMPFILGFLAAFLVIVGSYFAVLRAIAELKIAQENIALNYIKTHLQQTFKTGVDKKGAPILLAANEMSRSDLERALVFYRAQYDRKNAVIKDIASYVFDFAAANETETE